MLLWGAWRDVFRGVTVRGPEDLGDRLVRVLRGLDQEAILSLSLGPDSQVRKCGLVALGPCRGAHAEPRDLFRDAVRVGASSIVLAHNHSSGRSVPSEADLAFTKRILEAGHILGIEVLDHLVVTKDSWRSLRESTALWSEGARQWGRGA